MSGIPIMKLAHHGLRLEGVGPWFIDVMAGGGEMRVMGYCELDPPPRFPRRVWCVRPSGWFERTTPDPKKLPTDQIDLSALSALARAVGFKDFRMRVENDGGIAKRSKRKRLAPKKQAP